MTINEIRKAIRVLNWIRQDIDGATSGEFETQDVPGRFARQLAEVRALVIKPRFADDLHDQAHALAAAQRCIDRWEGRQVDAIARAQRDADSSMLPMTVFANPGLDGWMHLDCTNPTAWSSSQLKQRLTP